MCIYNWVFVLYKDMSLIYSVPGTYVRYLSVCTLLCLIEEDDYEIIFLFAFLFYIVSNWILTGMMKAISGLSLKFKVDLGCNSC